MSSGVYLSLCSPVPLAGSLKRTSSDHQSCHDAGCLRLSGFTVLHFEEVWIDSLFFHSLDRSFSAVTIAVTFVDLGWDFNGSLASNALKPL